MADANEASVLERICRTLNQHGVEFIIIGGQAENLHGSPRVSYDVDVCYQRTQGNIERMAAALLELHPKLRGAPPDIPFRIDARSLALGCDFTFATDIGDFDIFGVVEPLGDYRAIVNRAIKIQLGETSVAVLSLDDLIRVKQHLGRPKDKLALIHLLAIRDEHEKR